MNQTVIQVSSVTLKKMADYYQTYFKEKIPNGALFSAKKNNLTITAYLSGKVLFQGTGHELESKQWQQTLDLKDKKTIKNKQATQTITLPENFAEWSVIGSDEVGTGSYFGPLTVAATFVANEQQTLLKSIGVKDSKMLTDKQICQIAETIMPIIPYSLLTVLPEKYNQLQPTMNQGQMKAILHNQALQNVTDKINPQKPDAYLIDEFAQPKTYFRYLQDEQKILKDHVYFATKGEQHHLSVACASIIARYAFLESLKQLSATYQVSLPSGAGANVDRAAASILQKGGLSLLDKVAKLHFANTQKAEKLLH